MRYRYSEFPVDLLRALLTYQELVKLFLQLVLQTGGDVEEALRWMRYLQDRGVIDPRVNLDEFAKALKDPRLAQGKFAVEGHTDARGSDRYNLVLSQKRAGAVVKQLLG